MERCHSDFVFWYKGEAVGTINKIVKSGVLALEEERRAYVEFEMIVEDTGRCSS